jgi:hypothetical protein
VAIYVNYHVNYVLNHITENSILKKKRFEFGQKKKEKRFEMNPKNPTNIEVYSIFYPILVNNQQILAVFVPKEKVKYRCSYQYIDHLHRRSTAE